MTTKVLAYCRLTLSLWRTFSRVGLPVRLAICVVMVTFYLLLSRLSCRFSCSNICLALFRLIANSCPIALRVQPARRSSRILSARCLLSGVCLRMNFR